MIERVIEVCARNRMLVILAVVFLVAAGLWSMRRVPLDAIPDLTDVQVILYTKWEGRSPDLIEDQVTYPIVSALISAPRVRVVRGLSDFGFSYVYVIFEDGTDLYWARSRVLEYLKQITARLPEGVSPVLGPDATGVGWVFQYALVDETGRHDLSDLRGFQDWTLRYWLAAVPGVAEVASVGGFVREYQVQVDPNRLSAYGIPLSQVIESIRAGNNDVGGRVIESAGTEVMVRGRGYLSGVEDIQQVSVGAVNGTPIRVADVARVTIGPDMRRGVVDLDGRGEAVGGIVLMRSGENALNVIRRVKEKIREVSAGFPEGLKLVVAYDRSTLIHRAIDTLRNTLVEEMAIVSLVIIVFLFHLRSSLVPILVLPIAVVIAFIPMYYFKVTSNIMSLGGLALAIGVLVDAAIVMVENAYRHLAEGGEAALRDRERTIVRASQQVGRSIFFSLLIIVLSFLPVFLLEAQEGRLFRPLAVTKTAAVAASSVLAITLVPVLMILFLRGRFRPERENPVSRFFIGIYAPVLRAALRRRKLFLAVNVLVVVAVIPFLGRIGREFMPPLNEGTILYMPTTLPGISITEASRMLNLQDRMLMTFPEVERVFGKIGRAETATDPAPLSMVETIITLKPKEEWRPGMTWEKLTAEMNEKLQFPGWPNIWWMPIQTRQEMLTTGIRSAVGVKVLGKDLHQIDEIGRRIEGVLQGVRGTRSVIAERVRGGYFLDFDVNREAAARHGIAVGDVEDVIETAIGGMMVTTTVEGRERYPVSVRYPRELRDDPERLGRVLVSAPGGAQVPIAQLAEIRRTEGPPMIRDENGSLAGYVFVDVADRDLGGYVEDAKRAVAREVKLPPGYAVAWSGQYEYQVRAKERLQLLMPAVLFSIFVLLYMTFRSASEASIVMLSVVYAMAGGVVLQLLLGYNFSVAVWVGYIALYGVAVQTGVIMVVYLHEALDRRLSAGPVTAEDITRATLEGSVLRLRPKLMTVSTVMLSLLPIMWSTGTGSDVMKPIAAPILGGMVTSTIHVLIITPLIFAIMKERALRKGTLKASGMQV